MIRPQALLRELVAIPSVSSLSNRPLIERLQRFFTEIGWHERVLRYEDAAGVEKLNLMVSPWAMDKRQVEAELAIVCHTDTVPFGEMWDDATVLREQDGMLHGCGACDVKGFLACMLAAAFTLKLAKLQRRLCLVFTADEEVGCRGARFLLEQDALRARYGIVGEPTSLVPARAGKGYCLAKVQVKGIAAHSAYPEAGRSAIFTAARLLGEIERLAQEMMELRDDGFSPPWTTLNVGEIHGGTAKNVVPAECWFLLEWRPIPEQRPEWMLDRLRSVAERIAEADGLEVAIEVLRLEQGFATAAESPVVRAVQRGAETTVETIAFGTEAPWLARMGAETVVIGPGSMLTAHSPRERVPSAELDACVKMLLAAIERLCGPVM